MYLLSLSTLALLKCLLSLSFSPLIVFSMDAYMYMFGGGVGLEVQGSGLSAGCIHVYMCSVYSRFVHVHVQVYTYACIPMCLVHAEGLGIRDQGRICICMYVYMYMCMYVYWCIYVGSCNICIPTGCICSLHVYL
jgi:hypothetical protein